MVNIGIIHKVTGIPFSWLMHLNDDVLFAAIEEEANRLIEARRPKT